jgi:hypothetical protein
MAFTSVGRARTPPYATRFQSSSHAMMAAQLELLPAAGIAMENCIGHVSACT